MSFLTPLYIAGIAAVTLPIFFHLIRRTPRGRQVFSSVMFLAPSPPRVTRRSRLDNWPLLLLRAAALCLLAAAFARPFLRSAVGIDIAANNGKHTAILLDTSASMRRADLWKQAIQQAEAIVAQAGPHDSIGLYTFDRNCRSLVEFSEWNSLQPQLRREVVQQRLAHTAPGWTGTDFAEALVASAELLANETAQTQNTSGKREIILISDLQTGGKLDALNAFEWPDDVNVSVRTISPQEATNAGLQLVGHVEAAEDDGLRVRVSNAADSNSEQFRLRWSADSDAGKAVNVYVPPGRSRVVRIPDAPQTTDPLKLLLEGDVHEFDNSIYVPRPAPERLTVVYFGYDAADDPDQLRYYVERAFPEIPGRTVQVVVQGDAAPLISPLADEIALIIATETIPPKQSPALERYMENGGTLLAVAKTADDCRTFGTWLGHASPEAREAEVDGYAMLTEVDFAHPLFAPFADSQFADFTGIHVWKHRSLQLSESSACRVLARFGNDDPAIIERSLGKGRALLFTFGWHPDDSQLAVSSKFVPLLNGMLELRRRRQAFDTQYVTGDAIPLARDAANANAPTVVQLPDQTGIQLTAGQDVFDRTVLPGVYTVTEGEDRRQFTINMPADESKTSPLPLERLEAFGIRLTSANDAVANEQQVQHQRQLQAQELESQQKVWRWLLLGALAILLLETWLAGRMTNSVTAGREEIAQ